MPRYNYKLSEEKFVNPYTFVPVNFGKKPTEDINTVVENASELLTGVLNCSMYAKTPIAVPDISSVTEENEHSSYRFESTPDGQYMILGSSLRGMIRSVYETATDSCFSTLKENTLLNTRNGDAKKTQPGLLINENGEWKLYKATRYMLKVAREDNDGKAAKRNETERPTLNPEVWSDKCPSYNIRRSKNGTFTKAFGREIYSGEKIYFLPLKDATGTQIQYKKKNNNGGEPIECAPVAKGFTKPGIADAHEGYLVLGELISNKHHESIFEKGTQKKLSKPVIEKAMEGLEETIKVYRSNVNRMYGDTHYGYPEYENMKKRGCIPVWYIEKGQGVIFSLAAMGRISFQKTLNEHINQKQPCQSREKMCKACRLFGMAQKDAAVGGRVRFTDAIMRNPEKMSKGMVPLAELGTPRSSYMPFYSNMRDTRENGKLVIPSYDDPGITIRGRKYYWHSKDFKSINKNAPADGKRNASMQIADTGSEFKFDIYFDRITRQELRELVWTLNFWENKSDGVMCHKIGHGKPVGLGSVKIVVDQITCRSFSEENGYSIIDGTSLIDYSSEEPFADNPRETKFRTITALKKVCNFENAMRTRYPYITNTNNIRAKENDTANHKWFGENKSAGMKGHENSVQLLPDILRSQELRAYNIEEAGQNVGNNRPYRPRR